MKIKIEAVVYKHIYEKLRDKFFDDFRLNKDNKEIKDIWDETYKGSKTIIAKDLFQISSQYYFFRKYEEHAKQHIEVGYPLYPMPVDREQMVLALNYLLFGKDFNRINNFPEFNLVKYQALDWKQKYDTVLDLFKKHFPEGLENTVNEVPKNNNLNQIDILKFITSNREAFESEKIKTLINDFFKAINSKDHHKAWHLLSPKLQKNSMWDGDFNRFRCSFVIVERIRFDRIYKITFSYESFECEVSYFEKGESNNIESFIEFSSANSAQNVYAKRAISDMQRFIDRYWKDKRFLAETRSRNREIEHTDDSESLNWHEPTNKIIDMSKAELRDYNFQKFFSIYYHGDNIGNHIDKIFYYTERPKYNYIVLADMNFIFESGKWLIDKFKVRQWNDDPQERSSI